MARRKKHTPEQGVNLLRQIEVAVANRKTTSLACKEAEITEQTYYRWRKEYGGLQVDQARHLTDLVHFQTGILRLPPVERLFANPSLPDYLRNRNAYLRLLQHSDNLLHTEPLLPHPKSSSA